MLHIAAYCLYTYRTEDDIAKEFDVSVRTARRDVKLLIEISHELLQYGMHVIHSKPWRQKAKIKIEVQHG